MRTIGVLGAASIAASVLAVPLVATAAGASTDAASATSAVATPASATSRVGGAIKRSEVIARAKYWYDRRTRFSYNMNGSYPDPQGRRYRTDCSGYVSMALHLSSSLSTVTLPGVGNRIAKKNMHAGDYIGHMGPGTGGAGGHVRLFQKWANSAHTSYWAYDFGSTPVKHQVYSLSTKGYTAYSYKHITSG
jgi:hypothetical protein